MLEVVCLADVLTRKRTTSIRWQTWTTHHVATAFVRTDGNGEVNLLDLLALLMGIGN